MEIRTNNNKAQTDRPNKVHGYAATFGVPATVKDAHGRSFTEIIKQGAFSRTLVEQPDVRMLQDHDTSKVLGRTKSGTLRIGEDKYGLWYECDLPDTRTAKDLVVSIQRGDLDACSFGFTVNKDMWQKGEEMPVRELRDVTLYEVSVVAFPAYNEGTTVDLRDISLTSPTPIARIKAELWLREKS